jgi:hypothetical protein
MGRGGEWAGDVQNGLEGDTEYEREVLNGEGGRGTQ